MIRRISAADFSQLRVGVWIRRCRELRQVVSLMPASRRLRFRIQSQSTFVELRFPLPLSFSLSPSPLRPRSSTQSPARLSRFLRPTRTQRPLRRLGNQQKAKQQSSTSSLEQYSSWTTELTATRLPPTLTATQISSSPAKQPSRTASTANMSGAMPTSPMWCTTE